LRSWCCHAVVKLRVRLESGEAHVEDWVTVPSVSFKTRVFKDEEKGELLDLNGAPILLDGFATGVMLRPDVTNNESWDAVLVMPETTAQGETVFRLIFVEVTLQEVHSFNETADFQMFKKLNAMLVQRVAPQVRRLESIFRVYTLHHFRPELRERVRVHVEHIGGERASTNDVSLPSFPQVRHVGMVDAQVFDRFRFHRTGTLLTMVTRSGQSQVPADFSIKCEVAEITEPTI